MSTMQMQATVKDVEMRVVKKRDGSGEFTLYDVILDDDSKWTAFDKDLAEQAWNTRGTLTTLEVEVVQKGNYTNKNLKGVGGSNGGNGGGMSFGATTAPTSFQTLEVQQRDTFTPSPEGTNTTPKDISIWRQTATKVAAKLSTSELDFWANVDTLVRYYETGEKPNMIGALIERGAVQVGTGGIETSEQPPPLDDIPF